MTISLAPSKDCGAAGAVCTKDGRALSHALNVEVAGPLPPDCIPTKSGCLVPYHYEKELTELATVHRLLPAYGHRGSWGLRKIKADRAWARIELAHGEGTAPGAGQTVGVIDTGIDRDHPLFAGKTITKEFVGGVVDEQWVGTRSVPFSHGTAVASVIAGNGRGSTWEYADEQSGVAWGADIAMFAVSEERPTYIYTPATLAELRDSDSKYSSAINKAVAWRGENGRKIDFVNLSVGDRGIIEQYSEAELRANFGKTIAAIAQAGTGKRKMIFVWAAGNSHGRNCNAADFPDHPGVCVSRKVVATSVNVQPGLPVRIPELRGKTIAVAAVGKDGRISGFSSRCGIAADWCLAAPGEDIMSAYFNRGVRNTNAPDGTSFAAPMVTGALVVMKHYFRGQLSNEALAARLLATANKTGIYANRAIYGQGLLDLDAATEPVGVASVNFGDRVRRSSRTALARTRFAPGGAFGDGPGLALAGTEFAAFDELGAPFWFPLGDFVQPAPVPSAAARLHAFMAPSEDGPEAENARPLLGGFAPVEGAPAGPGPRLGLVEAPAAGLGGGHLSLAGGALSVGSEGPGGLGFAAFSTEGMDGRAPVSGALLSWRPDGAALGLRGGWLTERETLLGTVVLTVMVTAVESQVGDADAPMVQYGTPSYTNAATVGGKTYLNVGDTVKVTFTFSEVVTGTPSVQFKGGATEVANSTNSS
ncbi:MAG: S8 family serine peptidase, partial [Rhodospirillaceae bacterium]|nr:S8 family serine peptidase [Rhodospirillaceae bacterium]